MKNNARQKRNNTATCFRHAMFEFLKRLNCSFTQSFIYATYLIDERTKLTNNYVNTLFTKMYTQDTFFRWTN